MSLHIRRKIPFELENAESLAAKSQSSVHSPRAFCCAPQLFLHVTLFCFNLSTRHQTATKNSKIEPRPSTRMTCSKSKQSNQNLGIGSSCPTSAAACFESCPHSRCCQPEFPAAFIPLWSALLVPSAFEIPPSTFQLFISTQQFAGHQSQPWHQSCSAQSQLGHQHDYPRL